LKAKICIITHTHLSRNPRVVKEALALARAGYYVHILNSIYSKSIAEDDARLLLGEPIKITHVSDLSTKNWTTFLDRLTKKIGSLVVNFFGIETRFALGYAPLRYLKLSKAIEADLYICHQELPLYIGKLLLKKGFKVGFDLEDWHSENLSDKRRSLGTNKLLKELEKTALTEGTYCTTTSESLASQLAKQYDCTMPEVLYNSFDFDTETLKKQNKVHETLKLVWFSLNIGPGRGLEEIIVVLKKIPVALELHLIGEVEEPFKDLLKTIADAHVNLIFYELISTEKIGQLLSSFDIGLAIELHQPKNREYTITNKLFQYIQSGLPIIATNTAGQQEVFNKFQPGIMIDFAKINYLELEQYLTQLKSCKKIHDRVNKMACYYDWKKQVPQFLKIIENALQ